MEMELELEMEIEMEMDIWISYVLRTKAMPGAEHVFNTRTCLEMPRCSFICY